MAESDNYNTVNSLIDSGKLEDAVSACFSAKNKSGLDVLMLKIVKIFQQNVSDSRCIWLLKKACHHYPSWQLHDELGCMLYNSGSLFDSMSEFHKSLMINEANYTAFDSIESIKSLIVDSWHFRMLNDSARNSSYLFAIQTAMARLSHTHSAIRALDIGGGTGILSIMCAMSGAAEVYCCEEKMGLISIAMKMTKDWTNIKYIHKNSRDIVIGVDIPDKVDLIVSEIFDCGLFGEGCIESFNHARLNYLASDGIIVPSRAIVYSMIIESGEVRSHDVLNDSSILNSVNDVMIVGNNELDQPYLCINLNHVQYIPLSDVVELMNVPFDSLSSSSSSSKFHIATSGRADGVAVWFKLILINDISISSFDRPYNCWDQAVFVSRIVFGPLPVQLTEGDDIDLFVDLIDGNRLQIRHASYLSSSTSLCVGEDVLKFLNNNTTFETALRSSLASPSSIVVVDDSFWLLKYCQLLCSGPVSQFPSTDTSSDTLVANVIDPASGLIASTVFDDILQCLVIYPITVIIPSSVVLTAFAIHCDELMREYKLNSNEFIDVSLMSELEPIRIQGINLNHYHTLEVISEFIKVFEIDLKTLDQECIMIDCELPKSSPGSICHGICISMDLRMNDALQIKSSSLTPVFLTQEFVASDFISFSLCIDFKKGFYVCNIN